MRLSRFVPRSLSTILLLAALPAQAALSQTGARTASREYFSLLDWEATATGRADVFRAALRAAHRNARGHGGARYFGEMDFDGNQTIFQGVAGIRYWAESTRSARQAADRFTPDAPLTTTPEPATMALLATGLVLLAAGAIIRRPPFGARSWDA